jgi:hypothetical protein
MSYSTSNLLLRNLSEVFGENDPVRRRAAIDEMWHEDDVFYDPNKGIYRGRDEIDRIADAIWVTHPDFQYQPIAEPEQLGNGGRVKWVSGHPGELTPGLISSSRETAGFPPFISFSTSYPELDSAAHDTTNDQGFSATQTVSVGEKSRFHPLTPATGGFECMACFCHLRTSLLDPPMSENR